MMDYADDDVLYKYLDQLLALGEDQYSPNPTINMTKTVKKQGDVTYPTSIDRPVDNGRMDMCTPPNLGIYFFIKNILCTVLSRWRHTIKIIDLIYFVAHWR